MFQMNENDIIGKTMDELEKENYIVDMLVRTLYSNDVNNTECYHIIKLFKENIHRYMMKFIATRMDIMLYLQNFVILISIYSQKETDLLITINYVLEMKKDVIELPDEIKGKIDFTRISNDKETA